MSLVLTRQPDERIMIGDNIVVTFHGYKHGRGARIRIDAPGIEVHREEVYERRRMESGLPPAADWPGVFIRGDTALVLAAQLRELIGHAPSDAEPDTLEWLLRQLEGRQHVAAMLAGRTGR